MHDVWLTHGKLVTPDGVVDGAVRIARGRIAAIRARAPRGARAVSCRGGFITPGFIDLHVWGEPRAVSRDAVKGGTTAFLTTVGPEPPAQLLHSVAGRSRAADQVGAAASSTPDGARCLGLHLEGPFLNSSRAGAFPNRWMRRPTAQRCRALARAAEGRVKLITIAPELPGAMDAIRWWAAGGAAVSLGHSEADRVTADRAVRTGARAATHIFNAMPPWHHRHPSLLDAALTDPRLIAMVIADGRHVSPSALRLLMRAKGADGVALVTDSVRHQRQAWKLHTCGGAYYTRRGTLAGSTLTMIGALRNAVELGGASLNEAVQMASGTPARLLGLHRTRGRLRVGARADLVSFDREFFVRWTMVGGAIVYRGARVR